MKYAIIEDEEISRENLRSIINRLRPDYELVGLLRSVQESIEFLNSTEVDILFMDIDLGDGSCFDIIEHTSITTPIIFTTAYNEYAIEAFKVNSIDYLLKPIAASDVERALTKLEDLAHVFNPAVYKNLVPPRESRERVNRILISKNKNISFLNITDIAFFCIEERYVVAYTLDGKSEVTDIKNMEEVMSIVADYDFFQLSRSFIASIKSISSVRKIDNQRLHVTVQAGKIKKEIIISALRRRDFLNWLGHY